MKTKLILFILSLLCSVGMWAVDVKFSYPSTHADPYSFGTRSNSNKTFTTNASPAGLAGVSLTVTGAVDHYSSDTYQGRLALKVGTENSDQTFTIAAPSGYVIIGYYFSAKFTAGQTATITANGTEYTVNNSDYTSVVVTGLNTTSASFTVNATSKDWMAFGPFVVTLLPTYTDSYQTLDINSTNGSLSHAAGCQNTGSSWSCLWTSTSSPTGLTMVCKNSSGVPKNNMQQTASNINLHSSENNKTFTITAPTGYVIAGYIMSIYTDDASATDETITPAGGSAISISKSSAAPTYVSATDLFVSSTSFNRSYISSGASNAYATMRVYLLPAYDITYVLPGTSLSNVTVAQPVGSTISAPSAWTRDGVSFSYYTSYVDGVFSTPISTAPASAQTVYVDYTYSQSGILSTDKEHLSWYRLAALSTGVRYDLFYDGDAPYHHKVQSAFDGSNGYFWAFVGNPFDGVKVYNKAVATTNTLIYNDATNPAMGTDDGTTWYISINASGIGFQYSANTSKRWNDYYGGEGPLKYYSGESWYQLTAYDDVDYSGLYTANIAPYISNAGAGYFKISSTDASSLSSSYSTANADSKINVSEYQSLLTELAGYINWPATGYYRLKNVSADTYMKAESETQLAVGGTNTSANTIVYLNGSNGTYTMQMQGKYAKVQSNGSAAILQSSSVTSYFSVPTVDGAISPGKVNIGHKETATDNFGLSGSNVVGQNISSGASTHWTIEPATDATIGMNQVGDDYYATLYLPFDATISNATAYTLEKSGNYLVPTAVTDNEVPAGTPVVLKGTNATATATINTGDAFNSGSPLSCALTGTYTATTIDGVTDYVLGKKDGVVGFYHWDSNDLGANRAYLHGSAGVRGFALIFDEDDATAIENVNANVNDNNTVIYNLAGQRLNKMQKGINIVNGKKVLF